MVKLEDTRPTVSEDLPLWPDVANAARENQPQLSVLVAEVDQTGHVEEQLDEIVQHQQDQAQAVQTERRKDAVSFTLTEAVATEMVPLQGNILTSKCRRLQCGPGRGRCRPADVEYPPENTGWESRKCQYLRQPCSVR